MGSTRTSLVLPVFGDKTNNWEKKVCIIVTFYFWKGKVKLSKEHLIRQRIVIVTTICPRRNGDRNSHCNSFIIETFQSAPISWQGAGRNRKHTLQVGCWEIPRRTMAEGGGTLQEKTERWDWIGNKSAARGGLCGNRGGADTEVFNIVCCLSQPNTAAQWRCYLAFRGGRNISDHGGGVISYIQDWIRKRCDLIAWLLLQRIWPEEYLFFFISI